MTKILLICCAVIATFATINCKITDEITPCGITDGECQEKLFSSMITLLSDNGAPELDFPRLDPLKVKNITVSILNIIDINLLHGVVKGVKDCAIEDVTTSLEERVSTVQIRCDVSIKGRYKANLKRNSLREIFGNQNVYADGDAKVKLDDLRIKFIMPYYILKKSDGEILLQCRHPNKTFDYTYEIGNVYFNADNIYLGKQDISPMVVSLLNNNSKLIMNLVGKNFIDKAMDIIYYYVHLFFDKVPARVYIADDLEPFVDKSI